MRLFYPGSKDYHGGIEGTEEHGERERRGREREIGRGRTTEA